MLEGLPNPNQHVQHLLLAKLSRLLLHLPRHITTNLYTAGLMILFLDLVQRMSLLPLLSQKLVSLGDGRLIKNPPSTMNHLALLKRITNILDTKGPTR